MLNPKDIENLRKEFMKIDTDNSGYIEVKELESAIYNADFHMTAKEIGQII